MSPIQYLAFCWCYWSQAQARNFEEGLLFVSVIKVITVSKEWTERGTSLLVECRELGIHTGVYYYLRLMLNFFKYLTGSTWTPDKLRSECNVKGSRHSHSTRSTTWCLSGTRDRGSYWLFTACDRLVHRQHTALAQQNGSFYTIKTVLSFILHKSGSGDRTEWEV